MKTIKAIYYYMKQKKARLYFYYWHDKTLVNIKDTKKWRVCFDHMGHSMPTTPLEIRLLKLVEHPQQSAVIGQGILIQIML